MEWFFALKTPAQVAIFGVVGGVITAVGAVAVAAVNNARKGGGGTAEIAAVTLDSTAIKQVAAALEALNVTMTEQNRLSHDGLRDTVAALDRALREVEQLHREIRELSGKMRGLK